MVLPVMDAQTLDPTVEVSRSYEGKLMEVHKPALVMSVPDSVFRFDLNFDYSVFESPYKGSYEFNPYVTSMRPAAVQDKPSVLYLRAGAGYTFHPVFDLVWSPLTSKAFAMDVYAMNRSYIGAYRAADLGLGSIYGNGAWKGKDLYSKVGTELHWDWRKSRLDVGVGYCGIHRKSLDGSDNALNAVDFKARMMSKTDWPSHIRYDFGLDYRIARDIMSSSPSRSCLNEHDVNMNLRFGPAFRGMQSLYFDVAMMLASYSGHIATAISEVAVVPHYVFEHKRVKVDAGLRIAKLMRSDGYVQMYKTREQVVYPDVRLDVEAIKDKMMLYFRVGGGNKVNTYSSLLESNHFITMMSACGLYPLLDTTVERVSFILGAEGRVSSMFRYDFRVGNVNYKNALLDAIWCKEDGGLLPGVGYAPYKKWFMALDWTLTARNFRFDGEMLYNSVWGEDFTSEAASGLLRPAALKGDVALKYEWKKRVSAGIDCSFATSRKAFVRAVPENSEVLHAVVPGYADLGIEAEYIAGSRLSFWMRAGNLLNMPVMYAPLYAEKGVNFTLGVCLNM